MLFDILSKEWLALVFAWIALYGGVYIAATYCSAWIGRAYSITAFAILLYAVGLLLWSRKQKNSGVVYTLPKAKKEDAWLLLLLSLPVCNLLLPRRWDVFFLLLTIGACVVEEIFFRGFLFRFFQEKRRAGALLSSAVFALLHLVNGLQTPELLPLLAQVVSAFCAGICFCGLTVRYRSLLPSTLLHIAVNATGGGSPSQGWQWTLLLACSLLYAVYGWILIEKQTKHTGEEK